MQLIFGYQKEVPVKIKRKRSKTTLVGLALLIILLLIFLSFENLDGFILNGDTSIPPSTSDESSSLDKPNDPSEVEGIKFEKDRIYPEENRGLILSETKEI